MRDRDFFERAFADAPLVRLIEEDPDLFADLPSPGRADARARAVAPAFPLGRGPWDGDVDGICDQNRCLGLLVLDGLLVHSVIVASEPRSEVLGPGDVLRPWDEDGTVASVQFRSEWGRRTDPTGCARRACACLHIALAAAHPLRRQPHDPALPLAHIAARDQ
jgi:hypothetical protein